MAEKKPSKASVIRDYLGKSEHAEKGPTELAELIQSEHKGLKVTPQDVSAVKAGGKKTGGKRGGKATNGFSIDGLKQLKAAADALGGAEKAKEALELFA